MNNLNIPYNSSSDGIYQPASMNITQDITPTSKYLNSKAVQPCAAAQQLQMMPQIGINGVQQQQMLPQIGSQNNTGTYNVPETVTNPYFWPAYLKKYIGYWMRVVSFIGNSFTDYTGKLLEVGAAYIVLKPLAPEVINIIDLYSIKFVSVVLTTDPQVLFNNMNDMGNVVEP